MIKNKNFVILGGGTAGWFTALFIKKVLPNNNVTLIESSQIGTIGVGEATTPNIIHLFKYLNIDIRDVIKKTQGTIKNGISFENWNGDNKKYFHAFYESLRDFSIPPLFTNDCLDYYLRNHVENNLDFNEYQYSTKLSYENKIDLNNLSYALHFDANLLAIFLKETGIKRGINHIDGIFKNVLTNNNNDITNIILEDNRNVDVDFVFDCSGFARLLIGKHYKQKWISYQKHLPMKKTIIIPKEKEELFPYTKSIAMKNGWIFEIPLQHRVGRGYIFDTDYINEEQALKEAEEYYNEKINIKKVIEFEAGRFDNVWINNCIAIGLSSTFIEPLESTSLFLTIEQLFLLNHFQNDLFTQNKLGVKLYNEICYSNMEETLNFVYLHYITKRKDSKFWQEFQTKHKPPKTFEKRLEEMKNNNLRHFDIDNHKITASFKITSYMQVCHGLEIPNKQIDITGFENISPTPNEYKKIIDEQLKRVPTLKEALLGL